MKRLLLFDEEGFYIREEIVQEGTEPEKNQYLADFDEVILFHKPKLVDGEIVEGLTDSELDELQNVVILPTSQEILENQVLENKYNILMIQLGF